MRYTIESLPRKSYKLNIIVSAGDLEKVRGQVTDELIANVEISGFRKGMAPRNLAEKSLDEGKVRGEVINRIVNVYYTQALKEAHLTPIILPRIELKQFEQGKDFIFEAKMCEKPQITLGDYAAKVRALGAENAGNKILGVDGKPQKKEDEEAELNQVLETVLNCSDVEIPDLLVDEEVNHMLSRLIDQTSRLGMTVEQYLKSSNKTVEQIKSEFRTTAEKSLKIEFLLYEIGHQKNIQITDKEVSDTIKAAPDDKSREELSREEGQSYVKSVLLKNKVVQELTRIYEEGPNEISKS